MKYIMHKFITEITKKLDEATIVTSDEEKAAEMAKDSKFDDVTIKVQDQDTLDETVSKYYIEVSLQSAKKAANLFHDMSSSYTDINRSDTNTYESDNKDQLNDLLYNFTTHGIEMIDVNLPVDEMSGSGGAGAYNTPNAFSTKSQAKKRKNIKYASGIAESKYKGMIDKIDQVLGESYRQFTTENPKLSPEQKVKHTIKEVSKKLQEIENLVKHSSRLKTESGISRGEYGPAVENALNKISKRLINISERVRALGE